MKRNRIAFTGCLAWMFAVACGSMLVACGSSEATSPEGSARDVATAVVKKDRMELRRIERHPPACKAGSDCPVGSHCDRETSTCRWACIADSDCGPGGQCSASGSCTVAATTRSSGGATTSSDSSGAACQALALDERIAALSTLNDDQVSCANGDDDCPCGAYCNGLTSLCEVDCIAGVTDLPASIAGCGDGQACTPLGRCAVATSTPPPPVQALTLQIAPALVSANSAAGAVVVPIHVSVTANSLDFIQPNHPALVRYQFPSQPGAMPQLTCTPGGPLTDHCDLDGWAFHVATGSLVSDTKTIWVQVPQVAAATRWTIEGRSDWAVIPASAVVDAEPIAIPATDPGHYAGTMSWPNAGIPGVALSVPVEAFVTATAVALYEPSRILLPDGHAVLARDPTKVTMLGWLSSGSARYDVQLGLGPTTYDASNGQLAATVKVRTGSLRQTTVTLAFRRTGELDAPSCSASCATGSYCDAAMSVCLPGGGPAAGAGIVSATAPSATPSATLSSARVAAWNGPLGTVLANNAALLAGATPREQFERPYCYQAPNQGGPATFARGATLLSPSNDLACAVNGVGRRGVESAQLTFPLDNHQQEVGVDAGGNAFNLLTDCVADLDAPPTSALPGTRTCASLGRFLLALRTSQPDDVGYRLKTQLLRQWLEVNAYVANATVQNQAYEDALGVTGQPVTTRLAQALDRMDQDVGLLLDASARVAYAPDNGIATIVAAAPDYRFLRPAVRLTFNEGWWTPLTNAETGQPIAPCTRDFWDVAGEWAPHPGGLFGQTPDTSDLPCRADALGTLGSAVGYSIVLAIDKRGNNPAGGICCGDGVVELFDPQGAAKVNVTGTYYSDYTTAALALNVSTHTASGGYNGIDFSALLRPAAELTFGLVAIVKRQAVCFLMQARPNQPTQTQQVACPEAPLVIPNASLALGGASEVIDELSIWNRPLSLEEVSVMAARYFAGFNGQVVNTQETLPVRPSPLPGAEQAAGFPVHMLEAASAELNLARAYLDAAGTDVYTECLAGQHGTRDTVLGRVGQSLRTASVIEDEAASVVAAVGGATPWSPRYDAALRELAGKKTRLVVRLTLLQATDCRNPLGIAEEDLPLYVGSAGPSAAEKFFAGSRFLANAALTEIAVAGGQTGSDGLLGQARQAYNAARISQFQEAQGAHDSADRILKLSIEYEAQLKALCGVPDGEDPAHGQFPLIAGFHSGAITAPTCFINTSLPACSGAATASIASVPAACLRGAMGERVLAIQAAIVDAENAHHAYDRAFDQFDADMAYCGRLQEDLFSDEALLDAHLAHMDKLRRDKSNWGIVFGIINEITGLTVTVATGGKVGGSGGIQGIDQLFEAFKERELDEALQDEEDAYQREIAARKNAEEIEACVHKADNEKFAIDAARDTIRRATEQTKAAMYALDDAFRSVTALAAEASGQLGIEAQIDRTPPHLHYWLDQTISAYHAHLAYARRLTYLAVRAYEYEAQQSSGLRDGVLHAQLPGDLQTVASTILGATAPFAGRQIDSGPLVLSLRDDVLQIANLAQQSSRLDGTAPLTPTEAFKLLLTSDASKIYDVSGHYVGRGVRFSLRPQAVDQQTCAERLSRIMPSVTLENASQEITHTRLILAAANTFGSQLCSTTSAPAALQLARVQPSQALLVGDAVPTFQDPSAFSTTGLFPLINTSRDALRTMSFPGDDPSAFAGRGRYGDYILIFPDDPTACTPALCDGWSTDALAKVNDVLLRFDLVEQDNTHL